jgi:hypothetical protein
MIEAIFQGNVGHLSLMCGFFFADSYLYLFGQREIYYYHGNRVVRQIELAFDMILNGFLRVG